MKIHLGLDNKAKSWPLLIMKMKDKLWERFWHNGILLGISNETKRGAKTLF